MIVTPTLQQQIEDIQSFLLGFGWAKTGRNFFEALSEYLANILDMDFVCIDRIVEDGLEAQTVAIHYDGHFEDNMVYKLEELVRERTSELQEANELLTREIEKRREKEKFLKIAEEKYRTVADFTHDWETWLSPEGKFLYVSPSCLPTTGYTVEEFMDDPSLVFKITHPDDREMVRKHYSEKLKSSTHSSSVDFRIITHNGEEKWIGHSCQPVFDSRG